MRGSGGTIKGGDIDGIYLAFFIMARRSKAYISKATKTKADLGRPCRLVLHAAYKPWQAKAGGGLPPPRGNTAARPYVFHGILG